MKIIVLSDSHGNFYPLKNIMRKQRDADLVIHLGDGERDFFQLRDALPEIDMVNVRGNCDWTSQSPTEGLLERRSKRIFYTHGHNFGVKGGLDKFKDHARKLGADICLYGHTHVAHTEYDGGLYVMNPGSVYSPSRGAPSYGVVEITDAGIALRTVHL